MEVPILKQGHYLIASIQSALTDADLSQLREALIERVGRFRSRGVIVDVTALDVMDSFAVRTLRDIAHMARLRGVPLPSGRATWDACAGAYGERKIIVGSRRSAAPDVMCHEIGHALDDIDGSGGMWQSDSDEFRRLYGRCLPRLVSYFHRQEGAIGRREFFADAFAAIASRQRPALVDMLGGDTRIALDVMLYFNVRYGI